MNKIEKIIRMAFPDFHPTRWLWFRRAFYRVVSLYKPDRIQVNYGFDLIFPKSDKSAFSYILWREGSYEMKESELLSGLLNNGDIAFDIGANIGYYTCLFSISVGKNGVVYAFEPEKNNFRQLNENLLINNMNNVICHDLAFADYTGQKELYISEQSMGQHSFLDIVGYDSQVVKIQTFDDFVESQSELENQVVKVVKIDVEGYELKVLKGMSRSLSDIGNGIVLQHLMVEFFPCMVAQGGDDPLELFSIFTEHNLTCELISSTNTKVKTANDIIVNMAKLIDDDASFFYLHVYPYKA